MLDELILGGEIQETSKKNVLKSIQAQDLLQEVSVWIFYFLHSISQWLELRSRYLKIKN